MRRILLFIGLLLPFSSTFAGSCTIENGPPPLLVAYIKSVSTNISDIKKLAASNSQCRGEAGSFSNERRFVQLVDAGMAQVSLFGDLVGDFQYNIGLIVA